MKKFLFRYLVKLATIFVVVSMFLIGVPSVMAAESLLISSTDELISALLNSKDGDVILVGDIDFKPMPMGIISISKNITIKSGKSTNAVFTNATFALNGTVDASNPLKVKFENIDFHGDQFNSMIDLNSPPLISSKMPDIVKTMCAAMFKLSVNATYVGCSFEGYHYGYGGVFNAIYSSSQLNSSLYLNLDSCSFRNNAAKYGGSIYLSGYEQNINLDARHCFFEANAATTGGAIWAQDANIRLLDCCLINNKYLCDDAITHNGGALAAYACSVHLDGCLIANNVSGGKGAGIFCEISPFRTLIMENCTVVGNTSSDDEGIAVDVANTKYDLPAVPYIYFSSLVGKQNLPNNSELFGCLIVDYDTFDLSDKDTYCLKLTQENAIEKGLTAKGLGHISLPTNEYPIPKNAIDKIAGGKFANSLCKLQIGDNYKKEAIIEVEDNPNHLRTICVKYGDEIILETPERSGFSFNKWEYSNEQNIESGKVFIGGELTNEKIIAKWDFVLSENLYVILIPSLLLIIIILFVFLFNLRKKKATKDVVPLSETDMDENISQSDDLINRACENSEIAEIVSKREMEVLQKILEGKSRKQIADELFVTEATIKKHTASIYSKLNIHSRTELIYKLTKQ